MTGTDDRFVLLFIFAITFYSIPPHALYVISQSDTLVFRTLVKQMRFSKKTQNRIEQVLLRLLLVSRGTRDYTLSVVGAMEHLSR